MKLYIVSYGESGTETGEGIYYLITETGEVLYSHYCSNIGYAKSDLIENRPERIKECKERFGEYEVLYLGEDKMSNEELLKRHKKYVETQTN